MQIPLLMQRLDRIKKGQIPWDCARNVIDWSLAAADAATVSPDEERQLRYARLLCAWNLQDYAAVAEEADALLAFQGWSGEDFADMTSRHAEALFILAQDEPLDCGDADLNRIIPRLLHLYPALRFGTPQAGCYCRPLRVFVAESEEDYRAFYEQNLPDQAYYDYKSFVAVTLYHENAFWMVFKREHLRRYGPIDKLGECAHEMAHLALFSSGNLPVLLFGDGIYRNHMLNERLTDLFVLGKGLAWPLYHVRRLMGSSAQNMSSTVIEEYILHTEQLI